MNLKAVDMKDKTVTILVLGGYGGTGKLFCRYLLKESGVKVIVAGRSLVKAEAFSAALKQEYPAERISARFADASDKECLRKAFQGVDLLLVAATTTKWAKQIAETALEANIDYLDIYFQQDCYSLLEQMSQRIGAAGRCFITQAGFHPGLPSTLVRYAAFQFDKLEKTVVAMAMSSNVEKVESIYELVDMLADYKVDIFKKGKWQQAGYRDYKCVDFGGNFGKRTCYPIEMNEMRMLPELFPLQETGAYVAGFNWFIDYLVFPLAFILFSIKKGLGRDLIAGLLRYGFNTISRNNSGVSMLLVAEGFRHGKPLKVQVQATHPDACQFTVIPVIAAIRQYRDGLFTEPGLWMMGHLVEPVRLIKDMEAMGVGIQVVYPEMGAC